MNIFSRWFGSKNSEQEENEDITVKCSETVTSDIVFDDPEPNDLPEALRYIVSEWGIDYLKNRNALNILNDFHVFNDIPAAKHVIQNMQSSGYIDKIISARNWSLDSKSIASQYSNEYGTKEDIVFYITECIGFGLKHTVISPQYTQSSSISNQGTTNNGNSIPNSKPYATKPHDALKTQSAFVAPQATPVGPYNPMDELPNYHFPKFDLLRGDEFYSDMDEINNNNNYIVSVFKGFGFEISGLQAYSSPSMSYYELSLNPGARLSKVRNLSDEIGRQLSSQKVRILAPIPGKSCIGVEVPKDRPSILSLERVFNSKKFLESIMELPCAIGLKMTGEVFMFDLTESPHLLVTGATGQGKSVCLNAIITSLIYKKHPSGLKFVLIDPKKVEFSIYTSLKNHFLAQASGVDNPIITDSNVLYTLYSVCKEMDERLELLRKAHTRNIKEYNNKFIRRELNPTQGHKYLPYIVVIIDEYADLIMSVGREVEQPIARIAQTARAVGIHMIIATERPTSNIITSDIKANFPTRITFRVSSSRDSLTVIDSPEASLLVGRGDMFYQNNGTLVRVQCALIETKEIQRINYEIAQQEGFSSPYELPAPFIEIEEKTDVDMTHLDPMFEDAARIVVREQSGSTSLIQRKFAIGYNRANRIMDQLEKAGVIGAAYGSMPREVLIKDENTLENLLSVWL